MKRFFTKIIRRVFRKKTSDAYEQENALFI